MTLIKENEHASPVEKTSFIGSMLNDFFFKPNLWISLSYFNFLLLYFLTLTLIAGHQFHYWYFLSYFPFVLFIFSWRASAKEKIRIQIAHRIPFFADSMANCLAIGSTLEQAIVNSSHNLKGEIKSEFEKLIVLVSLGNDPGSMLKKIDLKFPRTGLRFLISLIDEYRELGIGISPILKKMAERLKTREEAEEKIRSILAAGSSYARLTIVIFLLLFVPMIFLLKDQMNLLLGPQLKPMFLFLLIWTSFGILIVTRITSMEFTRHFALRPFIKQFMKEKKWTTDELLTYSGFQWSKLSRWMVIYVPMFLGFEGAYLVSLYSTTPLVILVGFMLSTYLFWKATEFFLKGMVEDQLIKLIETFPELLQIFIIGLNTGLNTYLAFQFAQDAVQDISPRLLRQELYRTRFAMECGESHSRTWKRFAEMLPFETVVDFCEIMVIAPMHGESIVTSIVQMANSYQEKKLTLMEKKATSIGQIVIPLIVLTFFPLFLFIVFAPTLLKISSSFVT